MGLYSFHLRYNNVSASDLDSVCFSVTPELDARRSRFKRMFQIIAGRVFNRTIQPISVSALETPSIDRFIGISWRQVYRQGPLKFALDHFQLTKVA